MKKLTSILLVLPLLAGCARFTTTQYDISYDDKGNEIRKITTKAAATTFIEGDSQLTNFKANQTDKTQSAAVGALNQSAQATNTISALEAAVGAAVGAAVKAAAK